MHSTSNLDDIIVEAEEKLKLEELTGEVLPPPLFPAELLTRSTAEIKSALEKQDTASVR